MIYDVMQKRRSIRKFKPEPPTTEMLTQLIDAAITAPSAGNKQSWRFIIVQKREAIESAAYVVSSECKLISDILADDFRTDFEKYLNNFTIFKNAPVLMVPIYRENSLLAASLKPTASIEVRNNLAHLESHGALMSVSLAIQNILLMAEEIGLGACLMTGPLIAGDKLNVCFNVPDGWHIAALIPVGYPDETPMIPERKPASSIIKWA